MPKVSLTHADRLWKAGGCACGLCGNPVPEPVRYAGKNPKGQKPSVEHVFPRSPKAADLDRIRRLRQIVGKRAPRVVIAHSKCNNRKSNRAPTACEVLFLVSVNLRLAAFVNEEANLRTKARAARRRFSKERKRIAEAMQAEVDAF